MINWVTSCVYATLYPAIGYLAHHQGATPKLRLWIHQTSTQAYQRLNNRLTTKLPPNFLSSIWHSPIPHKLRGFFSIVQSLGFNQFHVKKHIHFLNFLPMTQQWKLRLLLHAQEFHWGSSIHNSPSHCPFRYGFNNNSKHSTKIN